MVSSMLKSGVFRDVRKDGLSVRLSMRISPSNRIISYIPDLVRSRYLFFFFFGVAFALSFARDVKLYMTPGGNANYALVCGPRVGLAPGGRFVYLFQPGGHFGAIPTKTPVFPHQFLVLCRLSFRQFFHVFMTILRSAVFFLKIFTFIWTLSVLSRRLIASAIYCGFLAVSGILRGCSATLSPSHT